MGEPILVFILTVSFLRILYMLVKYNVKKYYIHPRITTTPLRYTAAWKRPKKSDTYIDYQEYITSEAWQKSTQRLECIKAARNKCQMCGAMFGLEVHHITYNNLGKELPQDLVLLCILCHEHTHKMAGKGAKSYPPIKRVIKDT